MSGGGVVRALAPAKVNLSLEVHGRRPDGYHELTTVMAVLELADELEVRPRREAGITLAVAGPAASADIPTDSGNLVWRAAALVLERRARFDPDTPEVGLELRLGKRIPSRAGLGGGSSDAAAALLASERALGLPPDPDWRRATLAGLGADCVFFHDVGGSGLARCEGIGERVTPLGELAPRWVVLCLTPEVHCPTAEVFAAVDERDSGTSGASRWGSEPASLSALEARAALSTDLGAAASRAQPELRRWREALDRAGGDHLLLSGSGSSFFGLYASAGEAEEDRGRLLEEASRRGLEARFSVVTRAGSGGARLIDNDP